MYGNKTFIVHTCVPHLVHVFYLAVQLTPSGLGRPNDVHVMRGGVREKEVKKWDFFRRPDTAGAKLVSWADIARGKTKREKRKGKTNME